MTNINLCKKCHRRKYDANLDMVCGLTNSTPVFENTCSDFIRDEKVTDFKNLYLKPNEQRAKITITLIWILIVVQIISMISAVMQFKLLNSASNGGQISYIAATANDMREKVIAIAYLIVYIIYGISFIMWFRRAYFNLHLKVDHLSFSEGWAAGCWFVPFINLYRPYQIMKELYEKTRSFLMNRDETVQIDLNITIVGIWWVLFIINAFIGQFVFRFSQNVVTLSDIKVITIISILNDVISLVLSIITIKIIKDYSKVEGSLAD